MLRGYWIALHARDKFGTLTVVGIITLLAAQVFFNIGVVTGLIPNTGLSLPFFSYGGSRGASPGRRGPGPPPGSHVRQCRRR